MPVRGVIAAPNKDLDVDVPKFQFSSKPATTVIPEEKSPIVPAKEIKNFIKQSSPKASTAPAKTAQTSTQKKPSPKNSTTPSKAAKKPPSVRQVSNKVTESANELLAML